MGAKPVSALHVLSPGPQCHPSLFFLFHNRNMQHAQDTPPPPGGEGEGCGKRGPPVDQLPNIQSQCYLSARTSRIGCGETDCWGRRKKGGPTTRGPKFLKLLFFPLVCVLRNMRKYLDTSSQSRIYSIKCASASGIFPSRPPGLVSSWEGLGEGGPGAWGQPDVGSRPQGPPLFSLFLYFNVPVLFLTYIHSKVH